MSLHTKSNGATVAIGFSDDSDTGLARSAANTLGLVAGGTEVLTATASGLTFTGTQAQVGNLDLTGDLTLSGQIYNDTGSYRVQQGYYRSSVVSSIAGTTTAGGLLAMSNPFGADVIITGFLLNIGTAATSATATADFGVGAASNTSYDNLIDGGVLTATGIVANDVDGQGTNGKVYQAWASNGFITGTVASGNVTGLVAKVYVTAFRQ